jgi:hypothetical protein
MARYPVRMKELFLQPSFRLRRDFAMNVVLRAAEELACGGAVMISSIRRRDLDGKPS